MNSDPERRQGAQTRLGRTVRTTIATAVASSSRHREHHRTTNWLRDVILGGQDGLVNILGIILGVIAGGGSKTVLLAAGFAVVITIATLIGHLIPLLPFVWLARTPSLVLAIVLSALVLFAVGVYSAVTLVGDWRRSGLKMVVIGLGAAGVGFLIGKLFHASGA